MQSDQPEDLIGQPATPAEVVAPSQCAQNHTHPSIAASRPQPTVRQPKRLIEEV